MFLLFCSSWISSLTSYLYLWISGHQKAEINPGSCRSDKPKIHFYVCNNINQFSDHFLKVNIQFSFRLLTCSRASTAFKNCVCMPLKTDTWVGTYLEMRYTGKIDVPWFYTSTSWVTVIGQHILHSVCLNWFFPRKAFGRAFLDSGWIILDPLMFYT